jgi:hypothetical protein
MDVETIEYYYHKLREIHNENQLDKIGIKLPKLRNSDMSFTKDGLCLVFLYSKFQKPVSKEDLTKFIKGHYPDVNDVQQARHLGAQKGWYILSGTRGDSIGDLKPGEYMLHSVSEPYPDYTIGRRLNSMNVESWEELKKLYHNRCITCGSVEGKQHLVNSGTTTKLQQGHMNPQLPLDLDNVIPQCDWCNRAYRSYFCFDNKGRVSKINDPNFVLKSTDKVQIAILDILKKKFREKD